MPTCSEEILSILTIARAKIFDAKKTFCVFVALICLCTTLQRVFHSGVCQGAPLATLHMLTVGSEESGRTTE